jgi:uncharacterized protein YdeI (YjbR/CyaY-like superfamily)
MELRIFIAKITQSLTHRYGGPFNHSIINMENNKGIEAVSAVSRQEWRNWLAENSQSKKAVCLIIHHKKSPTQSINYAESIEEALCYG